MGKGLTRQDSEDVIPGVARMTRMSAASRMREREGGREGEEGREGALERTVKDPVTGRRQAAVTGIAVTAAVTGICPGITSPALPAAASESVPSESSCVCVCVRARVCVCVRVCARESARTLRAGRAERCTARAGERGRSHVLAHSLSPLSH